MHPCSVPGCGRKVPTHLLMCAGHWKSVPSAIQTKVYAAFRRYEKGEIGITELRAAQQPAIDAAAGVKGGAT